MANKINIENYEAFLLDYMEGTISTEDLVALQIFAAQHPQLNIDLNELELVELGTEEIHFYEKENLKKPLISDEQFVAYIENELNAEEKQNIETVCASNDSLAKELKLYKSTIINYDANIVFENKNLLKKQETKVLWLFSREILAAAASLILLFGLWFVFKGSLGTADLNSEKIKGNSTIKTFAIRNNSSTPFYTVEKTKHDIVPVNPMAYSTKKKEKEVEIKENTALVANNNIPKDTSTFKPKAISPSVKTDQLADNNLKPATNSSLNKVYVITEKAFDEDEKVVASNEKKGFWNRAMKTLNGLNKLGVKKAKGSETVQNNDEQYVLTLGNFKVENNKYKAN